ncbi:MAG: hypothetical protein ACLP9L_17740 [Thermoguttaceae bacterium]
MQLFARKNKKESAVRAFIVSLLNQNCHAIQEQLDGPRLEGRVNLTKVVMVIPVEEKEPLIHRAFTAITKEFSSSGVAVVIDHPYGLDEALLGFRWRGSITWIRAKAKHLDPMGGNFFQLGFRMTERLDLGDHPELADIVF